MAIHFRATACAIVVIACSTLPLRAWQAPPEGWTERQEGGSRVYSPTSTPRNGMFRLVVPPTEAMASQPLEDWFLQRVNDDRARRGGAVQRGSLSHSAQGLLLTTDVIQGSAAPLVVVYSAVRTQSGQGMFSYMETTLPPQEMIPLVKTGAVLVYNLSRAPGEGAEGRILASSAPPPREGGSAPTASRPSRAAGVATSGDRKPRVVVAVPGSGIQPSQMEVLLYEGRGTYTAMGYQYLEKVDLLLKDGTMYSGLEIPAEDLNLQRSRETEPEKWRRWRRAGSGFVVQNPTTGAWEKLQAKPLRRVPAVLNTRLIYRKAYQSGGGGAYITSRYITFFPDGQFERSEGVLAGTGVLQANAGFSSGAASYSDRRGSQSATAAASTGAAGGSVVSTSRHASSQANLENYGTYRVSGTTLELRTAAGQVQRLLIFYPFGDSNTQIFIGDATFDPPDK